MNINDNQKLWIVGMWRGNREILEKTVAPYLKYIDGIVAVVDSRAKKEDIEWLESIKGEGEIIVKKWVWDHAHTMNEILFSKKLNFPDYLFYLDETDCPQEIFIKELRENIKYWHKNNVGIVWLDHPLILRYHDGLRFFGSPHWSVTNIIGGSVNLTVINGYRKESYIFNERDTLKSGFLSPIKYSFEYPNFNNHFQLLYSQFGQEVWEKHEGARIKFRLACKNELGIELTLEGLKSYMINNVGKYPDWFEKYIEFEINIKDAFRLFVLKQNWTDLAKNRFNFSYFKWKEMGEVNQDKYDDYIGVWNQYKIQIGHQME